MPSFRSHLYAFVVKNTRRKIFMSAEAMRASVVAARRRQDHRPPKSLHRRVDIDLCEVAGMPVYEVTSKDGDHGRHILYLHGGAFIFEITPYHWRLIAEFAERLDARITVPIYPLAPESTAPEIIETCMKLYRDVLDTTAPHGLAFMGDSAGGNMAPVLAMTAALEGLPQPAAMVLISPALNPNMTHPDVPAVEKTDPWLAVAGGQEATRLYAGDLDFSDWRVTPLYGDLSVLPRTLMLTGTRDILNPDTHLFAEKARELGVEIEVHEGVGMFHVWPLLAMPEAYRARDRMVSWLETAVPATRPIRSKVSG